MTEATLRVLMIDDEPLICELLGATVRLLGGDLVAVSHEAKEGIDLFKTHRPDFVLLDFHMPGMNGIEVMAALREIDPTVKVVLFTADDNTFVAEGALEAGAYNFINKNLGPEILVSKLQEIIAELSRQKASLGQS